MSARTPSRFASGGADAKARLALLEAIFVSDDPEDCAQRSVAWLGEHARVTAAIVAVVKSDGTHLVGLADYGTARGQAGRISVDLEDRGHPLVGALMTVDQMSASVPMEALGGPGTRLGRVPFAAVPLSTLDVAQARPIGVLLLEPASAAESQDVRWIAEMLGHRLAQLYSSGDLADSERRLRREGTLLESVIDAVSDPIILTDTEGRLMLANSRAERLFAADEDQSEGRRRAVALNNMLFSSALSRSAFEDAESWRHELPLVDPSEGSDLLFELLSTVVTHPREGTGIVSVLRNVTDLRRATEEIEENYRRLRIAEAEVRAERDRLDLVIDSVADPIVVTDPAGNIVLMNAPAERLFTVGPDGAEEQAQRVRANDAHFTSHISNLFFAASGLRYSGGIALVDPVTGASLPTEGLSGKILSEHGEVNAVVTILHDLTEAKEKERLYEQLKRASDELEQKVRAATAELSRQNELLRRQHFELEQASALKSQFLANMSHEFRTPLNAILGYTHMLLHGVSGKLNDGQRRNLSRVDSNGRHLLSIINDILDIARIEAGRMPLNLTPVAVPELVNEVMAEMEPIIRRARLPVSVKIDPALPVVRTDRPKAKQIVLNLLGNALKFTPEGSVSIEGQLSRGGREVAIAVTDTGIGIAEADYEKIFEDFRQADNSVTREYGGTGLGLSICRRLANMLGGRITVASKLGQGSTFTVTLPIRERA
jgi:PAS domain S-box-containing protein